LREGALQRVAGLRRFLLMLVCARGRIVCVWGARVCTEGEGAGGRGRVRRSELFPPFTIIFSSLRGEGGGMRPTHTLVCEVMHALTLVDSRAPSLARLPVPIYLPHK